MSVNSTAGADPSTSDGMASLLSFSLTQLCLACLPTLLLSFTFFVFSPFIFMMRYAETIVKNNDTDCKKYIRGMEICSPYICFKHYRIAGKDQPHGFLISRKMKYLAYISYEGNEGGKMMQVRLWCTDPCKKKIERLAEGEEEREEEGNKNECTSIPLTEYRLGPSITWTEYVKIVKQFSDSMLCNPEPGTDQHRILSIMIDLYKTSCNHNTVCLIYGPPGTGKSTLAYLLAMRLNGSICKFNPTLPGESIAELYSEASPTFEKPLILLEDEYDQTVRNAHENRITRSNKVRTLVSDKSSHNTYCDDIKTYPNTIVLRTMNTPKSVLESCTDASYMRKGRINGYFVCKTSVGHGGAYHEDEEDGERESRKKVERK